MMYIVSSKFEPFRTFVNIFTQTNCEIRNRCQTEENCNLACTDFPWVKPKKKIVQKWVKFLRTGENLNIIAVLLPIFLKRDKNSYFGTFDAKNIHYSI